MFYLGRCFGCLVLLALLGVCGVSTAKAFNADLGKGVTLDFDVSLTYSVAQRLEDPDPKLISDTAAAVIDPGLLNADDGNRNFEKGDLVNNRVSAVIDIDLQYEDYGLFVRPRAYFDYAYDGSNSNNDPLSNNNMNFYGGSLSSTDQFTKETKDSHRDEAEILDLFLYGTFDLGERGASLRVGRHVVSWGESLFIQNSISGAMAPLDATAANIPGSELKELFLPVEQVSAQVDVSDNLSMSGFYQWKWHKTRIDEAGSYFNTSDLVDDAGERMILPLNALDPALAGVPILPGLVAPGLPNVLTISRAADVDPDDSGQWGVNFNYIAEGLGGTEFGLYYINYHEKNPMLIHDLTSLNGTPSPTLQALIGGGGDWTSVLGAGGALLNVLDMSSYYLTYAEDVKLIGATVAGVIGETNYGLELTYRQGMPVEIADNAASPIFGFVWKDAEVAQVQLSIVHFLGKSLLWDNLTFIGEIGANRVYGEEGVLFKDRSAYGFVANFAFEYFQVLQGLDLKIPVSLKMNPAGVSAVAGTFTEDKDSIGINFDFTYKSLLQFGVGYVNYLHSADKNPLADRDLISAKLKYTF